MFEMKNNMETNLEEFVRFTVIHNLLHENNHCINQTPAEESLVCFRFLCFPFFKKPRPFLGGNRCCKNAGNYLERRLDSGTKISCVVFNPTNNNNNKGICILLLLL